MARNMNKASRLLLLIGLALMAMATTTVASRILSQETTVEKGGSGELTLEEAKTAAAYAKAFEHWPPPKNEAQKAVKVVEVDADGNELQDVTATATTSGVVPARIYYITWRFGPLTVYVTFDTATFTLTARAVVQVPLIGARTLGPITIRPPTVCVNFGYSGILSVKVCISLTYRRVTLTGTILGRSVTITLITW